MVYQNTATLTALRFGGSAEVRARRVVEATPQRDERDRATDERQPEQDQAVGRQRPAAAAAGSRRPAVAALAPSGQRRTPAASRCRRTAADTDGPGPRRHRGRSDRPRRSAPSVCCGSVASGTTNTPSFTAMVHEYTRVLSCGRIWPTVVGSAPVDVGPLFGREAETGPARVAGRWTPERGAALAACAASRASASHGC